MKSQLDEIASGMHLTYLSDLHALSRLKCSISDVLNTIPSGSYSVREWTSAVRYILLDPTLTPACEQEARALLCKAAHGNPGSGKR
ncbi:MAG: hypothetical protein EOM69_04920 [Clostridia bacterium]|nr:hypothetical protein [Clostridia bacterium]